MALPRFLWSASLPPPQRPLHAHVVPQEAIDRAMRGRTVLVIAHRLSTVRDADQVIVIEKVR